MPTAELIKPATLHAFGRVWVRGEQEPIDNDMAALLEDNPRFRVRGFGKRADDEGESRPSRPSGAALNQAIRKAVDGLDVDDESSFTASGAPNVHAVSYALGYAVTRAELDRAMKGATSADDATAGDMLDDKKTGGVKIKRVARPQDPGLKSAKATPKDGAADAGSTEGAIEV